MSEVWHDRTIKPSVLICGTCYCDTELRVETVKVWARLARQLNPGIDIVLIDALSPFDPAQFLPPNSGIKLFRFDDNPGHMARGGGDGAGRSYFKGAQMAVDGGYDYFMHWEADVFLARPVQPIVDKLFKSAVNVAALPLKQYDFFGWEISFLSVPYIQVSGIIQKYDWEHAPPFPIPEIRMGQLTKDDLWLLPLHGIRNDQNQVNYANLASLCPYSPMDWITRCDPALIQRFLQINGIVLT